MIKITLPEVGLLSRYIYDHTGISLDINKAYLIESRLTSLVEMCGCSSFGEFHHKVRSDSTKALLRKVIDAITTNETFFFRDKYPFDLLRHKILPDLFDRRGFGSSERLPRDIRIWSAACSTGQELYSIAIVLKELLPNLKKYNIKILGTDLSDAAITQASYGRYSQIEIERGLSPDQIKTYFISNGNYWAIRDEIRAMAMFQKVNLMDPFHRLGKFAIIFCRNVAIYFSREDRVKLFNKMADVLQTDGYLIVGGSESLADVPRFEAKRHLKSTFYQPKSSTQSLRIPDYKARAVSG